MSDYVPTPAPALRTSTLAIVSLIGGIAGLTLVPFLGSIVGVITGHLAKSEIKKNPGTVGGGGLATGGLITGYLGVAIGVCGCLLFLLMWLGLFSLPFLTIPTYSSY